MECYVCVSVCSAVGSHSSRRNAALRFVLVALMISSSSRISKTFSFFACRTYQNAEVDIFVPDDCDLMDPSAKDRST